MADALFVGIDVSADRNMVQLLSSDGEPVERFSVDNNLPGAKKLLQKVRDRVSSHPVPKVVFGLEATSVYGDHLVTFLKQAQSSLPDPKIHVLNPRQVKYFKGIYPELPKNDCVDAFVIAESLRFGRISKEVWMDEKILALQKLTRNRFYLVKQIARLKNAFLNHLFLKFSAYRQESLFSNIFGATSISLLATFFSVDQIVDMPMEELAQFLVKHSKNRFENPEELAAAIKKAANSSYRLPKTVNDSINQVLASYLAIIRTTKEQLDMLDKGIATYFQMIPNTLQSIPGIGPVYAAGIIAEIGDIHRFKNHAALAKYAGLAWNEHQSGKFKGDYTPAVRSGNRYLKYYLLEAANSVKVHVPEYRRFYERKYRETPKTPHKRALALTARKLVRLIDAMLRSNRLYIPPVEH